MVDDFFGKGKTRNGVDCNSVMTVSKSNLLKTWLQFVIIPQHMKTEQCPPTKVAKIYRKSFLKKKKKNWKPKHGCTSNCKSLCRCYMLCLKANKMFGPGMSNIRFVSFAFLLVWLLKINTMIIRKRHYTNYLVNTLFYLVRRGILIVFFFG